MAALGGIDAAEVRIGQNGKVYFAATGAAAPTDVTTAMTSAWTDAGYISEDGAGVKPDVSTKAIKKWQAMAPVKYLVEEVMVEVKFVMNQYNRANTALYFFGQTWVPQASGTAKMSVTSNPAISNFERSLCIEVTADDSSITRFYFPRGIVVEREEVKFTRTSDIALGLTYHAMDNSGEMFQIFTNNTDIYTGS